MRQEIEAGKIQAARLASGELLVAGENNDLAYQTKEEIIAGKFAHLRGQPIKAYGAQKKYGIHRNNFIRWARAGYIRVIEEGKRLLKLDEADVAYCAYVYEQKKAEYEGQIAGVTIFDDDGNPYQVKYPDLSAQRRR